MHLPAFEGLKADGLVSSSSNALRQLSVPASTSTPNFARLSVKAAVAADAPVRYILVFEFCKCQEIEFGAIFVSSDELICFCDLWSGCDEAKDSYQASVILGEFDRTSVSANIGSRKKL